MRAVLLALLAVAAPAQDGPLPPPPPAPAPLPLPPVRTDEDVFGAPLATDTLAPRPAPDRLADYRADPDFQYDDPRAEGPSLWQRFWAWLTRLIWEPIRDGTTADGRRAVLVLVAVLALGWAVARLLRVEGGGVFARRSAAGGGAPLLDVEDIAEVDLEARLSDALGRGDHREAVRVRYLRTLQALDAAGALAWRRDKTNRQYVAEVAATAPDAGRAFARATRVFDAVWYGERPVPPALYAELAPLFDAAASAQTGVPA